MAQTSFQVYLPDHEATTKLGTSIAQAIDTGAVIALSGQLGAGKTTLVQAVARGLGVEEVVNSPTFTMLNEYHSGRLPLYHMDLYRLCETDGTAGASLLLAELDEMMETSMVAMIEWAELLEKCGSDYLHQLDHVVIDIKYADKEGGEIADSPSYYARAHASAEIGAANAYIKDEIGRMAALAGNGAQSAALLGRLAENITDMLIYS